MENNNLPVQESNSNNERDERSEIEARKLQLENFDQEVCTCCDKAILDSASFNELSIEQKKKVTSESAAIREYALGNIFCSKACYDKYYAHKEEIVPPPMPVPVDMGQIEMHNTLVVQLHNDIEKMSNEEAMEYLANKIKGWDELVETYRTASNAGHQVMNRRVNELLDQGRSTEANKFRLEFFGKLRPETKGKSRLKKDKPVSTKSDSEITAALRTAGCKPEALGESEKAVKSMMKVGMSLEKCIEMLVPKTT